MAHRIQMAWTRKFYHYILSVTVQIFHNGMRRVIAIRNYHAFDERIPFVT